MSSTTDGVIVAIATSLCNYCLNEQYQPRPVWVYTGGIHRDPTAMPYKKFALLLHASGVSAAELGRKLGVERQVVQNWVRRGLPASRLFEVAEALDMSAEELRPYVTGDRLDAQKMLDLEVEAFLERLPKLPKAQRLYVLERLFNLPTDDD